MEVLCQLVRQNANSMYRSRQNYHRGRVEFVKRQELTYPGVRRIICSRAVGLQCTSTAI